MKKATVYLLILAMCLMACTGTFHVTKAVNKIHRSQTKWADELIFLCLVIIPVYEFAMLGDAIIFNTIEFWTGKNPIASTGDTQNTIASNGQDRILMKYDTAKDTVEVIPVANKDKTLILSRTNDGVVAMDRSGKVLFTSVEDQAGGITIFDTKNHVVNYFSPDAVETGRTQLFQN